MTRPGTARPASGRIGRAVRAVITARATPVAAGRRLRRYVEPHRAEHRLVRVRADMLNRQLHVQIAAIVVWADDVERHGLAVDGDAVVRHLDAVAGQAHEPFDVVDGRIDRVAKHHHIAALRGLDVRNLRLNTGQRSP